MDYVHGIFQARIQEWVSISSSKGSSCHRGQICVICISMQILYFWTGWDTSTRDQFMLMPSCPLGLSSNLTFEGLLRSAWTPSRLALPIHLPCLIILHRTYYDLTHSIFYVYFLICLCVPFLEWKFYEVRAYIFSPCFPYCSIFSIEKNTWYIIGTQ